MAEFARLCLSSVRGVSNDHAEALNNIAVSLPGLSFMHAKRGRAYRLEGSNLATVVARCVIDGHTAAWTPDELIRHLWDLVCTVYTNPLR